MSILDTTEIGTTIPFDHFPLGSTFARLVVPVQNPPFWGTAKRPDPPAVAFQTYERTPDGWRRVK